MAHTTRPSMSLTQYDACVIYTCVLIRDTATLLGAGIVPCIVSRKKGWQHRSKVQVDPWATQIGPGVYGVSAWEQTRPYLQRSQNHCP